jgi:hypothetical protein
MIQKLNELDKLGLFKKADQFEKLIVATYFLTKKKPKPLPPLFPVMSKLDEIQNMLGEPSADTSEESTYEPTVEPGVNSTDDSKET